MLVLKNSLFIWNSDWTEIPVFYRTTHGVGSGWEELKQEGQRPLQVGSTCLLNLFVSRCALLFPLLTSMGLFNNLLALFIYNTFICVSAETPSKPWELNFVVFLTSQVKNWGLEKSSHMVDCDPTATSNGTWTSDPVRTPSWHLACT